MMSNYNQTQAPPLTAYPAEMHGYAAPPPPPPPVGYPTRDGSEAQPGKQLPSHTTKSRGDGFWKGCCAALCCCCVLDACL